MNTEKQHDAVVGDAHNDLLMSVVRRPPGSWPSFFRDHWYPQLRAGGINLQVLPVFIDDEFEPEGALRQALRMVEAAHRSAEANADLVALCRTGVEIDAAIASDRIALVLALEGCSQIHDDVELLETFARLAVRAVSFTHFGRTMLADGSGEAGTGSRLTSAGVEAVKLLESLGVLVDVSHLGPASADHVLELARRPVIASHSCAAGVFAHHRNLADDHLRGIAATGGVVCVTFVGAFLTDGAPAIEHLVEHIEHVVEIAGEDHVGLGSDFYAEVTRELSLSSRSALSRAGGAGEQSVPGLEGPSGMPLVTAALERRGFDETVIRKVLGANLVRLFGSATVRADPRNDGLR